MFGLLLKGISSIGVALCFSIGKAIFDVVSGRRSPARAILSVGLTSVFHGISDVALDTVVPNIALAFGGGRDIQVSLRDIAECTAKNVIEFGIPTWLDSRSLETLPSGLTLSYSTRRCVRGSTGISRDYHS